MRPSPKTCRRPWFSAARGRRRSPLPSWTCNSRRPSSSSDAGLKSGWPAASGLLREGLRLKLERSRQMLGEILPVMAAGIDVRLVRNVPRRENSVQRFCAVLEAVIVLVAAVEVDLEAA